MRTRYSQWPITRVCGACCLLMAAAGASDFEPAPGSEPSFDQGILELAPAADIAGVVDRYGFTLLDSIPGRNIHMVSFRQRLTDDAFERLFVDDPEVDHSELNFPIGDAGPGTQSTFVSSIAPAFSSQPVWAGLNAGDAHAVATGRGVVIAVIDTGLDAAHPAFAGRVHPAAASVLLGGDPSSFADAGDGTNQDAEGLTDEMVGHGTWVAGLALGVAPDASILPIRALDDEGFGGAFTIAKAIFHAIDHGADVINLSLGSVSAVRVVDRAADEAAARGIIVVASAGNQASLGIEFPASHERVVGVAALDTNGRAATFSNVGDSVLISAPGVDLVGPLPGSLWGASSGTSAAAPLVAGAAALLVERGTVRRWHDFRRFAREASVDLGAQNPGMDEMLGEGGLDLALAVRWPGPCFADLDDDEQLTVFDILMFFELFAGGLETDAGIDIDLEHPRGWLDVFDILFFFQAFASGCPG